MAQALKLAPNDPLLLHAMSVTLLVGRRYEEAIPMIERALSLSPKNAGLLNLRGNCRLHLGQPDLALEDFAASAKLDVTSPYPLGNAGYVHYAAGRNEQALRFYDEALGRSPGDPDYLEARGLVLFQMGRLEEAEAELDRLVAARPDAGAYSNRGAVRSRRERFAEAEADYREALRLSPDDPGTTYNLAILRQRQGRIDEAAELYRKSIDLGRTQPETWRALVKALLRIRKAAEAEAACTQGLQAAPGDVALIWDRALARAEQGNLEGALADYRKVLELKPGEARLERDIGVTLTKLGRMEEAIGPLERAVAGGATDVLSLLATCFTHAGQMEKAGAAYDRGVEVHPRNPMNWFARAQFRHRVGKAAEAVLDLDQAISLNSEFAEAIGFRGVLKLELKQSAAAVKDLQRAIDLKPGLRETFGPFLEKVKEE
jgi:tetratricopeptide (TPR) repeat protein